MKNPLLFLGSGVSQQALNGATVDSITARMLTEKWRQSTSISISPCPDAQVSSLSVWRAQEFLKLLCGEAARYNRRRHLKPTYEDLYYLAQQIQFEHGGRTNNPAIGSFLRKMLRQTAAVRRKQADPLDGEAIDLSDLAESACDFIQWVVYNSLCVDVPLSKVEKDFRLVGDLCRHLPTLEIVTLNHDLLVEQLLTHLKQEGIEHADGFEGLDGDIRGFDPSSFERQCVRLYKLHGSINWWERRHPSENRYVKLPRLTVDPWQFKDSHGRLVTDVERPMFMTGTGNKLAAYGEGAFAEIHSRFLRLLDQTDLIVMSGYGWKDSGINARLWQWFLNSRRNQIVLLYENPEKNVRDDSHGFMRWRFDELRENGQLIIAETPQWLADTSWDELQNLITDTSR